MTNSQHDEIAEGLAKKFRTKYNRGKGPDIPGRNVVIEVETAANGVKDALRQLSGFKKSRYIALPKKETGAAKTRTKGLKVGIMDQHGNVVKPAKRPGPGRAQRRR